jgi:SAM-dependent methyltransferase
LKRPDRASIKRLLPDPALHWLRRTGLHRRPPLGLGRRRVGRRLQPVSRSFGFDRGTPIDRYYIETFLARHGGPSGDIRGRVLEVADRTYTDRFAASGHITTSDVLDVDPTNPAATLILDLGADQELPPARFECIICTQTLLLVYDVRTAMRNIHRLLAPGGVLLLTVPGISQICREEVGRSGDYWRFTSQSVLELCREHFQAERVEVEAFGNVLTAAGFLYGLAAGELRKPELDHRDTDYEVIVAARAAKGGEGDADPG